jgi:cytochrome c peroxidase
MIERVARGAILAIACSAVACDTASVPFDADVDAQQLDPDPVFTAEERAALATLRYDDGPPPTDPSNRVADDPAARAFGQRLFFDPSFAGPLLDGDNNGSEETLGHRGETGRVSCAGCHLPTSNFVDTRSPHRQISLGAQWTQRRSPTLLEIAFAPLYNWDGRRDSLWAQAIGVMESEREFNSARLFVAQQIHRAHREEYVAVFGSIPALDDATTFPPLAAADAGCVPQVGEPSICRGVPGDGAEFDAMTSEAQEAVTTVAVNAAKAMAAYVRLLRCGESAFDRWLDGDEDAIDRSAQRGAALFVGRANCISCHSGPRLTDGAFHNVGLTPGRVADVFVDDGDLGAWQGIADAIGDPLSSDGPYSDGDRGVLPSEVNDAMLGAFRTPTLRCIATQPSFMHTAQLESLEDVVYFFDRGGHPPGSYPGVSELAPIGLSERERADLVRFIESLQGAGPDAALLVAP